MIRLSMAPLTDSQSSESNYKHKTSNDLRGGGEERRYYQSRADTSFGEHDLVSRFYMVSWTDFQSGESNHDHKISNDLRGGGELQRAFAC